MPEAGRHVKCSETHQPFLHTSYPHMQTLTKTTSYPTQIYLSFIFFCIFYALLWPSCKGYLCERSSPCSTLCPKYQACQSQKHFSHDILCFSQNVVLSEFIHMSWLGGFILISLNYYYKMHQEPVKWPYNGTLKWISHAWVLFNINSIQYR